MGMFVTGVVAAIVVAVGASYITRAQSDDRPVWQVYSTSGARVDDPGHNLVGPGWTGEAVVRSETGEPAS